MGQQCLIYKNKWRFYWCKRYEEKYPTAEDAGGSSAGFHPIEIKNTNQGQSNQPDEMAHIELEYPNGAIFRIGLDLSEFRIVGMIKSY